MKNNHYFTQKEIVKEQEEIKDIIIIYINNLPEYHNYMCFINDIVLLRKGVNVNFTIKSFNGNSYGHCTMFLSWWKLSKLTK